MINIKKFKFKNARFIISVILTFVPFIIFTIRLIDWQIINTEYYKKRAQNNSAYIIKTEAIRGEILDKDGEGLVINSTGYRAVIDRIEAGKNNENYVIAKSVSLLESLGIPWRDNFPIRVDGENYVFSDDKDSQINALKKYLNLNGDATVEQCMEKLIKKYSCSDFSVKDCRNICSVRYNTGKSASANSRVMPYILADNLSRDAMTIISEFSSNLKGLKVETCSTRVLPDGLFAPHIIGYTGSMSAEEYEKYKGSYSMDESIGKTGVEGVMEQYLRGKSGKRILQKSRDGLVSGFSEQEAAVSGNSVYLTISSKLQKVANESLAKWVNKAKEMGVNDCKSGAVVVLDVKDFSVLAASTYPSYDLNRFIEDNSYYSELLHDKATPLLNRAFSGAFAPGSVYKPLIACAALQENLLGDTETIRCSGGFSYYKGYTLKCMGTHGSIDVVKALEKSCNVFFAELGRRLGATKISDYAHKFGIGVKTGLELSENSGIIAGPEHSKAVGAHWYESGSSQAAIGQSDNMITPVQLATYVATIANNGNRYKTHLIKKVTNYNKDSVILENTGEYLENTGVSEENLQIVKQGMRNVVLSGTARDFANYPIAIAAKTGTAQNSGSDHTTFVCFAPYENPQIAISVVVANGKYGAVSKGIAKDILDEYFQLNKDIK